MSYIDTFNHELVGNLNGLPIYHPLETVSSDLSGEYDFSCSTSNLVLGGGAGEHPALVIHHLEALVAKYVLYDVEQNSKFFSDRAYKPPTEQIINKLIDIAYAHDQILEFCSWSMTHTFNFVQLAKSILHSTPLGDNQSVEEWIQLSIGEFIYFSLSELNPLKVEMDGLSNLEWITGYWMRNVTCPPPNYIKTKKQSLAGNSFKLRGFFRWDYQYPPLES